MRTQWREPCDIVVLRGTQPTLRREVGLKMASNREDVAENALDLTRDLENDEGVQAQLWIEAQQTRADRLEKELKKLHEKNRNIEAFNSKLVKKIDMLKANHARIVAGLERFRKQLISNQS